MRKSSVKTKEDYCSIHGNTEFFFNVSRLKDGSGSWACRACRRILERKRRQEKKLKAIGLLGGKCSVCGNSFDGNPEVFDFHHTDPSAKEFLLNKIMGHTWDKIQKEISKCVLVCSNCHRILHAEQRAESLEDL